MSHFVPHNNTGAQAPATWESAAAPGRTRGPDVYNRVSPSPGGLVTSGSAPAMLDRTPLLILMDGHALVHRAWHAIRQPLTVQATGEEVRAVYGFLNSFLRTLSDWQPTHCAIAFDLPEPTFRHREFADYKAHRPPTPPELRGQFRRIRELVTVFGIPIYEMAGYEADDILGTLSRQAERKKIETLILTGDTDTLQLVSPLVRVLMSASTQRRTVYDEAAVMERYGGLRPEALPDVKALQGDSSDNIPGVPGVGGKTAIRLVNQFGSVEGIYEGLDSVAQARLRQSLDDNRGNALQGKRLTTIVRDVPVDLDLDACEFWRYDRTKIVDLLTELEFFSAVSRIPHPPRADGGSDPAGTDGSEEGPDLRYATVDTPESLDRLVAELARAEKFAFHVETASKDPMRGELAGIAVATEPGRAWYVPTGHAEGRQLPIETVLAELAPAARKRDGRQVCPQCQPRHDGAGAARGTGARPPVRHYARRPPVREEGAGYEGARARLLRTRDAAGHRPGRLRAQADHDGAGAHRTCVGVCVRAGRLRRQTARRPPGGA